MEKGSLDRFSNQQTEPRPLCDPGLFKKVFFRAAQEFYARADLDFEVDGDNKNFLGHFCRYWNRDPGFELLENISLRKGLLVFGSYRDRKDIELQDHPGHVQTIRAKGTVVSLHQHPGGSGQIQ